jgi:hypothetical protein
LGCFLVGFLLTTISLLFGFDHGGHDGFHFGGHHGFEGGHGDAGGAHHDPGHGGGSNSVSFFSYSGMLMFLTFFGGFGYILNRHASGMLVVVWLGAIASGFVGASFIFLYLNQFLMKGDTRMRSADYHLPGTLARVTSGIRENQAGEIIYVQGGTRKTAGARSDEGREHPQGEEVVIVRYEKGIAFVRSVEDGFKDA